MSAEPEPAPSVQQMLGASGACPVVRWNGKAYKLGHPTQAAKGRLEDIASDEAIARIEAKEGRVKPATIKKMLDRVCDRVVAGDFKTWKPGWQETVWGDGGALFALSLFHEHHPEMTVADVTALIERCGSQYRIALAKVLPDFFEMLLAGREDITPEQKTAIQGAMAEVLKQLLPQPSPTPENIAG